MKIRNSLKSLKARHRDCRVIRRRGRTYVINKTNRRFKARQGYARAGNALRCSVQIPILCAKFGLDGPAWAASARVHVVQARQDR